MSRIFGVAFASVYPLYVAKLDGEGTAGPGAGSRRVTGDDE